MRSSPSPPGRSCLWRNAELPRQLVLSPLPSVDSWVYAEGQQLVGVQVVERAQVRQAQQQLGEDGAVVGAAASHQRPKRVDETLLKLLQGTEVLDACTVCQREKQQTKRDHSNALHIYPSVAVLLKTLMILICKSPTENTF